VKSATEFAACAGALRRSAPVLSYLGGTHGELATVAPGNRRPALVLVAARRLVPASGELRPAVRLPAGGTAQLCIDIQDWQLIVMAAAHKDPRPVRISRMLRRLVRCPQMLSAHVVHRCGSAEPATECLASLDRKVIKEPLNVLVRVRQPGYLLVRARCARTSVSRPWLTEAQPQPRTQSHGLRSRRRQPGGLPFPPHHVPSQVGARTGAAQARHPGVQNVRSKMRPALRDFVRHAALPGDGRARAG
jgi:hypothetical protein